MINSYSIPVSLTDCRSMLHTIATLAANVVAAEGIIDSGNSFLYNTGTTNNYDLLGAFIICDSAINPASSCQSNIESCVILSGSSADLTDPSSYTWGLSGCDATNPAHASFTVTCTDSSGG